MTPLVNGVALDATPLHLAEGTRIPYRFATGPLGIPLLQQTREPTHFSLTAWHGEGTCVPAPACQGRPGLPVQSACQLRPKTTNQWCHAPPTLQAGAPRYPL